MSNPDWHAEDVKAAIRKTGFALSELSIKLGLSPNSLRTVLRKPWPRVEAMVAAHLGRQPWIIWPSRYDAKHKPLTRPKRPARRVAHKNVSNENVEQAA